ncbi:MAG: YebC/PmpR family DNA-binding transcriptional regulator [Candidatus Pacebacteria bacterium]|nr:YebC/PmpR family DNA-binding transcriptional regulator [Candidatus Paceibacterota bacterium]
MSGHSHAKNVKKIKDLNAKKRSTSFTKISRNITLLAKQGSPGLKTMIEKAKKENMPKDSIEKAIKRGTGELKDGVSLEEFTLEAYGPEGTAIIAEGITDNKNRTIADFRSIINERGGKPAEAGSVKWLFDKLGVVHTKYDESTELWAIDSGALDIKRENDDLAIFISLDNTDQFRDKFDVSLEWVAKEYINISNTDEILSLIDELESSEDIERVFVNTKL